MSTKPTREQMTLAHALGWSVELLRAANTVTNDTIAINTNLENINRPANVIQPKDPQRYIKLFKVKLHIKMLNFSTIHTNENE